MEGGFGLFEEGIVASALDHVQRPAVPRARSLGHTEPRLEVMAPPDQDRGHSDPREGVPRDGPHSVLRHRLRRAALAASVRPFEGVGANWLKVLAHLPTQSVEIDEALREEAVPRTFRRPRNVGEQRKREPGRRPIPAQTEAVDKNQPAELVGRSLAKRAAIAPPSKCPTSTGGDTQVCSISSPSHMRTRSWSSGPSGKPEAPWPGRSGATTRCVVTRSGITRPHRAANSPGPCSRSTGGPSPPSSTAEETPASCSRRSVTGRSAKNRSRRFWPANAGQVRLPRAD